MLFRRNKNKISRRKRVEIYRKEEKKKKVGLVFNRPVANDRNIPKQYANDIFGRPFKSFYISTTKLFIFIIIVAALIYAGLFSPIFKIKKIVVVNNQIILEGDIVKFLEERNIKNKNIFLLNSDQVKNVLLDYYVRIEDARVYKSYPAKIRIKIKEKPSTVIWQSGVRKYLLDNTGIVISEVNDDVKMPTVIDSASLPVSVGDKIATKEFIDFINIVDESLKKRFGLNVTNYIIEQTTYETKVNISSGFYIIFDTTADVVEQLDKLAKVYQEGDKITSYVILSVDGKVIVK